jgi:hypothetical protein
VLLNFQAQFVEPIQQRTKRHTLRAPRKDEQVPAGGELLYLYTGLRRPGAHLIGVVPCVKVEGVVLRDKESFEIWNGPFDIRFREPFHRGAALFYPEQYGLTRLQDDEGHGFALTDGFPDFPAFVAHWRAEMDARLKAPGPGGRRTSRAVYLNLINWGGQ